MTASKTFLALLLGVFALAAAAQRRRPQPLAPSGYFLAQVATIVSDGAAHTVVLVREADLREGSMPKKALLITVGGSEGASIAMGLSGRHFVRPLTHDLVYSILGRSGMTVKGAYIHSLHKDTYFARLELKSADGESSYDCRPSDALALAVRFGAPIWIEEKMFERAALKLPEGHPPLFGRGGVKPSL